MSFEIRTIKNKLPTLPDTVRAALVKVVEESTHDIAALAQEKAPVDTGTLKGSIIGEAKGLTGEVSTNVSYSIDQEFGTHKMAAHPFIRPAVEEGKEPFFDGAARAVNEAAR